MKLCYCHTCDRFIMSLGIARHRAMHRDKKEDCTIMYSQGDTYTHLFADRQQTGLDEPLTLDKIKEVFNSIDDTPQFIRDVDEVIASESLYERLKSEFDIWPRATLSFSMFGIKIREFDYLPEDTLGLFMCKGKIVGVIKK